MGDDEILQLFYHRVEYAISAVEEKYGRLCRSVARGILKDERDVEECVNDTCMRAWNAIPPEKPRSLEAYLVRITRNLALDRYAYHHSQKRETALTEAYEELEACLPLAKDGPEEAAMVQELQRTRTARGCPAVFPAALLVRREHRRDRRGLRRKLRAHPQLAVPHPRTAPQEA